MRQADLQFDASGVFAALAGMRDHVAALAADLEKIRDEIVDVDVRMAGGQLPIPPSKQPHGGAFFALPQQQLLSYYTSRDMSPLGQLLAFTKRLMSQVDRVVVVGPATMMAGPRAIMAACCQPFYNELSRADRGSRPRVTFAGDDFDNDMLQGLLHLLGAHHWQAANDVIGAWGLVLLCPRVPARETELALKQLREALSTSCRGDASLVSQRLLAVELDDASTRHVEAGCRLQVPSHVSEPFTVLSPLGLTPAAILGVNIMKLQEGALAVNDHFIHAKAAENMVLQSAAVSHLLSQSGCRTITAPWDLALEQTGHWAAKLLASCGAPRPVVMSGVRDVSEYIEALARGEPDGIPPVSVELLATERYRFDVLPAGTNQEHAPARLAKAAYLEMLAEAGCPSQRWTLPSTDEFSLGQFLQAKMLSAVVQARLAGVNPYAQKALERFRGKLSAVV